jgi:hypothetical protein
MRPGQTYAARVMRVEQGPDDLVPTVYLDIQGDTDTPDNSVPTPEPGSVTDYLSDILQVLEEIRDIKIEARDGPD